MIKRLSVLFLAFILTFGFCSCGQTEKSVTTSEVTTISNSEAGSTVNESQRIDALKNSLPEYDFDEIIEEHYEADSKDYYINAKATKQQFEEYVELCKNAGYVYRVDDGSDACFFNAYSDSRMEVSVSYSEKDSAIFVLIYKKTL